MLERVFELDGRDLADVRPPVKRLIGCCRDFTVLYSAMARQHGIAARARVGFATYFVSGSNVDH
jgi:transglutaminase-like putative cysteine protease